MISHRMGSKLRCRYQIADAIEHLARARKLYCEPFCGGASVFYELYNRGAIKRAYLNDTDRDLTQYFQSLQDSPLEMAGMILALGNCYWALDFEPKNERERAIQYYFRHAITYRCNLETQLKYNDATRGGIKTNPAIPRDKYGAGFMPGNPSVPATRNVSTWELSRLLKALQTALITSDDYLVHVTGVENGWKGRVFYYFDPPYHGTEHECRGEGFNHKLLRDRADDLCCAISYNDCPEIRELYKDWKVVPIRVVRNMKLEIVTELLFVSPKAAEIQRKTVNSLGSMFGGIA